jgi:hypothetical protein
MYNNMDRNKKSDIRDNLEPLIKTFSNMSTEESNKVLNSILTENSSFAQEIRLRIHNSRVSLKTIIE